jgi:cell division protein FtsB
MRELQQKQQIKHRMYSLPALGALLVIAIFLAKGTVGVIMKEQQSVADVAALKAKMTTMSDQETSLRADISALNTEAGIDAEIKDKFNVSAAGEHVAIIVDPTNSSLPSATTAAPWYKRMWSDIISAI